MIQQNKEQLVVDFYEKTAQNYDQWHLQESEHNVALRIISALITELGINSVFDTACGTGRGLISLAKKHDNLYLRGNDITMALLKQALANGVPQYSVDNSSGYALPYKDEAFDFAIECGSLHHVAQPDKMIAEMLRISRVGIAISDSNMYTAGFTRGLLQNSLIGSLVRLALMDSGLLVYLKKLIKGHEYSVSTEDGVFYLYSIFQSLRYLQEKCHRIFVIPLDGSPYKDSIPLLGASHCLIIAVKNDLGLNKFLS